MFCEKCGAKNDSTSKFCEKCGAKLSTDVEEKKKETKKASAKKSTTTKSETTTEKKETKKAESKSTKPTLSSKQKKIGGLVIVVVILLIAGYVALSKMTSLESFGSKVFDQLSSKQTISDKYLKVPLNSDKYFISLEDTLKATLKSEDIVLKHKDYEVNATNKRVVIKYRDTENKDKWKLTLHIDTDGKQFLFFDKYIIKKITIENTETDKEYELYNPKKAEEIKITSLKDSKVKIDGKELKEKYLDSDESDDSKDVYVVKGIPAGKHEYEISLGSLKFKKEATLYSYENEISLTSSSYISSEYMSKDDAKKMAEDFKKYLSTYYEYVMADKDVKEFSEKYKTTDKVESTYDYSKQKRDLYSVKEISIDEVKLDSMYYYNSDKQLSVRYDIKYSYKQNDDEKRSKTMTVSVYYDIDNTDIPAVLSYIPF